MANKETVSFNLRNIPVKSVKVITDESETSHGLVIGCPIKTSNMTNPNQFFSESLYIKNNENINDGTFLYIRNINDIKMALQAPYDPDLTENTLFYYIRFAHRQHCITYFLATKRANKFAVCFFVKKISLKHITESRNHVSTSSTNDNVALDDDDDDDDTSTPPPRDSRYIAEEKVSSPPPVVRDYLKSEEIRNQEMITTPYGELSLKEMLNIKIRQRNIVWVSGIPSSLLTYQTLRSQKYFGRFGRILNMCIDASVSITFANNVSALNAIHFCNNFIFRNGEKMSVAFGYKTYCREFVLHKKLCKAFKNCPCIHSWYDASKVIKDIYSDCAKEELRKEMEIIGKTHHKLSWNDFESKVRDKYDGDLFDLPYYFDDIFSIKTGSDHERYLVSRIFYYKRRVHDHEMIELKNQIKILNQEKEKTSTRIRQLTQMLKDEKIQFEENKTKLKDENAKVMTSKNKYEKLYRELLLDHAKLKENCEQNKRKYMQNQAQNKKSYVSAAIDKFAKATQTPKGTGNFVDVGPLKSSQTRRVRRNRYDILKHNGYGRHNTGNLNTEICKMRFRYWLVHIVGLEQYLSCFAENGVDNIVMIEFLSESIVKNELKIVNPVHSSLMSQRIEEFKIEMKQFIAFLEQNELINRHKYKLICNGIVTLAICKDAIKTKNDLKDITRIYDQRHIDLMYSAIHVDNH